SDEHAPIAPITPIARPASKRRVARATTARVRMYRRVAERRSLVEGIPPERPGVRPLRVAKSIGPEPLARGRSIPLMSERAAEHRHETDRGDLRLIPRRVPD